MKNTNKAEAATAKAGSHTPGPWGFQWAYREQDRKPYPYEVFTVIGNINEPEFRHSIVATSITDKDDARLIAVAPALLKALKWIAERLERGGKAANSDTVSQARAAIAQAEKEGV